MVMVMMRLMSTAILKSFASLKLVLAKVLFM